jgi:hypothetical protein
MLSDHTLSSAPLLIQKSFEPHVCNVMVASWIEDVYRAHLGGVSPEAFKTASNHGLQASTRSGEVHPSA